MRRVLFPSLSFSPSPVSLRNGDSPRARQCASVHCLPLTNVGIGGVVLYRCSVGDVCILVDYFFFLFPLAQFLLRGRLGNCYYFFVIAVIFGGSAYSEILASAECPRRRRRSLLIPGCYGDNCRFAWTPRGLFVAPLLLAFFFFFFLFLFSDEV